MQVNCGMVTAVNKFSLLISNHSPQLSSFITDHILHNVYNLSWQIILYTDYIIL